MISSNEIRKQFIDYFVERHGHRFVPSSSSVPVDDPTLMFANAGMNQFKDLFLGTGSRPYRRAANIQKCIRVSGKHNDLEDVGRDTYHHTFFQMLGNWSFGDYYKREAILWAWDLLTNVWGIDKRRLHATVFGGDEEFGLEADEEASRLWSELTDIDPTHIHRFGRDDNFWMMGDTGPCGPCSEINIDLTPDCSGGPLVNAGDPRVIEIWNLVFIQFNRNEEGQLTPLPARHVDTGMGFERIVAVLEGKSSNYDTDVFSPLIAAIADLTCKSYRGRLEDRTDIAFRVIADHVRMLVVAMTDGALPGNKGRGSVLRSVLRRAVRFGWQEFDQREPFLYRLAPTAVTLLKEAYPEVTAGGPRAVEVIRREEADFLRTIERGLSLFEETAGRAKSAGRPITGKDLFDLYTTFGFPPDLTRQMAAEQDLAVDESDYESLLGQHEERSRTQTAGRQMALNVSGGLPETNDRPKWSGRHSRARVLGWIREDEFRTEGDLQEEDEAALLLNETCFYAEAGGQVGDQGLITTETGVFRVTQTTRLGGAVAHLGFVQSGQISGGQDAQLHVDSEREFTAKNHTATHLAHWALRRVLGEHVEQRGSRVRPGDFTFDFTHSSPLSDEEKREVERLVNEQIYRDEPVRWRELPIEAARELPGVRAFFGDKYGDVVRVVEIGDDLSREFCGGTHLEHTGQAGLFKIVGEESVARGIRRITAVTGPAAVALVQQLDSIVSELAARFTCKPDGVLARVDALREEYRKLQQQLKRSVGGDLGSAADRLLQGAVSVNGSRVITGELPEAAVEQVRQQVDRLRQKAGSAVVVFGWPVEDRVQLIAGITDDLAARGVHAGKLIAEAARIVGGSGGGKATLAQAGGKEPLRLAEALDTARRLAVEQLSG